ncbi:MAG: ATP synthase F1 subunit epsilon [Myxococcota bacterium]
MSKLQVSIVTPEGGVTRREVNSVTAPSKLGEVTILPDHVPLLAELDAGVVTMRVDNAVDQYAVSGGFLEVERDNVLVLADDALRPEEVDVSASERAITDAQAELKTLDGYDPAYVKALRRIKKNEARIRVAGN